MRHWREAFVAPACVLFLPAPGDQTLAEAQFTEDVHHRLHGRVVSDGEGAQVQDASQLQRLRVAGRQLRSVLGEVDHRAAHHAVLFLTGVLCKKTGEAQKRRKCLSL